MGGKAAWLWLPLAAIVLALAACQREGETRRDSQAPPSSHAAAESPPQESSQRTAPAGDAGPVIVALGDSLTAGFGLQAEQGYPALLQERLRAAGYPYRVVNAGVSGDTSAGGLARMDWLLRQPVAIFIVALGANDGLRGVNSAAVRGNLDRIIVRAHCAGARVLLAGMLLPSNYGRDYRRGFAAIYPELAQRHGLAFLPFLLEDVAARAELNLADGMHPNARGQAIVADNVWKVLEPMLKKGLQPAGYPGEHCNSRKSPQNLKEKS